MAKQQQFLRARGFSGLLLRNSVQSLHSTLHKSLYTKSPDPLSPRDWGVWPARLARVEKARILVATKNDVRKEAVQTSIEPE